MSLHLKTAAGRDMGYILPVPCRSEKGPVARGPEQVRSVTERTAPDGAFRKAEAASLRFLAGERYL